MFWLSTFNEIHFMLIIVSVNNNSKTRKFTHDNKDRDRMCRSVCTLSVENNFSF